jgi:uncharacterized protein (TIGR02996 family)
MKKGATMNGSGEALRRGLLEEPCDSVRWAVYADLLEEQGDPAAEHVHEFATCLTEEERQIARYIPLAVSIKATQDAGHAAFCRQILGAAEDRLRDTIFDLVNEHSFAIVESEAFCSESAVTNAGMWNVDEVGVDSISWNEDGCVVSISYSASGDHDEDRVFSGDAIDGTATVLIDLEEHVYYEDITAEIRYDEPEFDDSYIDQEGHPE